ncbi:MAG: glutamate--tRNA ligase family protein [Acetobacteraceae bacterium]
MSIVTRFAPSPTGYLHLGHAFAALTAWGHARAAGGRFLLRIEDIDPTRCRPAYAAAILEDLAWLGIDWDGPVRVQSAHLAEYRAALDRLAAGGLLYPCFCTRAAIAREVAGAVAAPQGQTGRRADGGRQDGGWPSGGPQDGRRSDGRRPDGERPGEERPDRGQSDREQPGGRQPDGELQDRDRPDGGPLYPGTCRGLSAGERAARIALGAAYALRLDMARAIGTVGERLWFLEAGDGQVACHPERFGDVVLGRKDTPASYHLCVSHDDAAQGVTLVTRGEDLRPATDLHRLLQALLGWPAPAYAHHRLLTDPAGRRLAKRDGAVSLRALRAAGISPAEARARTGWTAPDRFT